jgi:ATP synthase protein I
MSGSPDDADAPDGRSVTSKAAEWASRIMTISLEMVLPGLAGYWLDTKLGTRVVFLLVGFALGGYLAFLQLRAIARTTKNRPVKKSSNSR